MKKENEGFWQSLDWRDWTVGVLVLVIVIGVAAIASPEFRSFIGNAATAAWVQAVGVIGAVGVAIWVPHNDRLMAAAKEKKSQLSKDHEMLTSLSILADHAVRAMDSSTQKIENEERPIPIERLKDVQESFRIMLAKELPSTALPHILDIQCEIAYQISAIELHNIRQNNLSTKAKRARTRTDKVKMRKAILCNLLNTTHQ